jgi:hypothetical protein
MILKATCRGGSAQLATHLMKSENEHISVHDIRGFSSHDLAGAMREAYAISCGSKASKYLLSLSLNPPPKQLVAIDVFEQTLARVEERLGLQKQPRVIVLHEKEGRRHAHAVYLRIDIDSMKAIELGLFKKQLMAVARETFIEQNWKMPPGLAGAPRDPRNYTLAEHQRARRVGTSALDVKTAILDAWATSDSCESFKQALNARAMRLCQGRDERYVVVTHDGQIFAVARAVSRKAKEVRARLGQVTELLTVAKAQEELATDMASAIGRHIEEVRRQKQEELAPFEERRRSMAERQRMERQWHEAALARRWSIESRERVSRLKQGIAGLWQRITGAHTRIVRQNEREALFAWARDREQRDSLTFNQQVERSRLQDQIQDIRKRYATTYYDLRADLSQFNRVARSSQTHLGTEPLTRKRSRSQNWEPEP